MASGTFPWSSAANYTAGPDVGTATKVAPVANSFIRGTPATAQSFDYLLNERDVFAQSSHPIAWQSSAPSSGYYSAAYFDATQGVWLLGYNPPGVGATALSLEWNTGYGASTSIGNAGSDTSTPVVIAANGETPGTWAILSLASPSGLDLSYFGPVGTGITHVRTEAGALYMDMLSIPGGPMLYMHGDASSWTVYSGLATPTPVFQKLFIGAPSRNIARTNGAMAIFADNSNSGYATTADGVTFVNRTFPSGMYLGASGYTLTGLAWHASILGSAWVAIVSDSVHSRFSTWTSPDGISWSQASLTTTTTTANSIGLPQDMASAGHHLAAVCAFRSGSSSLYNNTRSRILTSEDMGVTWHLSPASILGDVAPRIFAGNGQFCVKGGGSILFSDQVTSPASLA